MLYGSMFKAGVQPCCEWNGDTFKGNILEYENSQYLKDIKNAMEEHDMSVISKTCKECIDQEKHNGKSARTWTEHYVNNGKYKFNAINKLDFRPDNLCNLKCRMCSPHSSSLIEKEMIDLGWIDSIEKRDVSDVFSLNLKDLQILKLIGGEPTINKNMFEIMDYLIKNDWAKNVNLQYTTNCTSINDFWLNKTAEFQHVDVCMSIDATGSCFEYIRRGAKWTHVAKNIPKIIQTADNYSFNIVVQTTNFAMIETWIEYFLEFNKDQVNFNNLSGVIGSINVIPDHIKKEKIQFLEKINHPIAQNAITYFENSKFDKDEFDKFWPYTEYRDILWNTDIYELDPIFERMKNLSFY
jgi:hypothetical protein